MPRRKHKDSADPVVKAVITGTWRDIPSIDVRALLDALAAALNACDRAGLRVKLKHGIVFTTAGYVLPTGDEWAARTLAYTPFSEQALSEDED